MFTFKSDLFPLTLSYYRTHTYSDNDSSEDEEACNESDSEEKNKWLLSNWKKDEHNSEVVGHEDDLETVDSNTYIKDGYGRSHQK